MGHFLLQILNICIYHLKQLGWGGNYHSVLVKTLPHLCDFCTLSNTFVYYASLAAGVRKINVGKVPQKSILMSTYSLLIGSGKVYVQINPQVNTSSLLFDLWLIRNTKTDNFWTLKVSVENAKGLADRLASLIIRWYSLVQNS